MRNDDHANIICLPGRVKTADDPLKILDAFIATPFSTAARHLRRLEQVAMIEENQSARIKIVPAVLAHSKEEFVAKISHGPLRAVAPLWQIDVLDGSMFGATSWFDVEEITLMPVMPQIELHLMINNPLPVIEAWKNSIPNLQRVIIHAEIDRPVGAILQRIRELNLEAGLAINPETPIETISGYDEKIDLLLVMGVHPGASGRSFVGQPILQKIREAKTRYPTLKIAVDGGINLDNAAQIVDAGAHQLCIASALWETNHPERVYQQFASL
jgi:ribulose-phosphate 3-epimerase